MTWTYFKIRYWICDHYGPLNENLKLSDVGDVAEIYLNHLNKSFVEFVGINKDGNSFPFVHFKYASLQRNQELKSLIYYANKNPILRLKFNPFTDSDWRIVIRQIADKLGIKNDPHNLMKHFTDFGQYMDITLWVFQLAVMCDTEEVMVGHRFGSEAEIIIN